MEPNKRYTQTVEKAFHLSMASLDAATASKSILSPLPLKLPVFVSFVFLKIASDVWRKILNILP